jgi:hypothetical protein
MRKNHALVMASLAMCMMCSLAAPSRADLGGDSIQLEIAGVGMGISWSVSDSGVLTQSVSAVASQTATWQATNGGCIDPLLGPFPVGPFGSVMVRTSACSSGIVCRDGQPVFRIQSGIWAFPFVGDPYRVHQMIDREFFPGGTC